MKKISILFVSCFLVAGANAQFGGFLNKVRDKTSDKVSDKLSDKAANSIDNNSNQNNNQQQSNDQQNNNQQSNSQQSGNGQATVSTTSDAAASFKTYSNYDFVPGDTVIFEDHFADDQDGEFPAHWSLEKGQGILNKVGDDESFVLTEGNYVLVAPRMKNDNKTYLTSGFTVEFNFYANPGYGVMVRFNSAANDDLGDIHYQTDGDVNSSYFKKDLSAPFPGNAEGFKNKWHHGALIYKNGTIKCYVDQYRVLVMPNVESFSPEWIQFGGIGDQTNPIIFKDIRLAKGGNMNLIGKKFTDAKIVTHGINFDVDKATLKPESMGTLNMIVKVLNNNPDLKFEIDGHTDNTGTSKHNLDLSQQRADAVKTQLVSMGVDASRLTTKGLGDTKPISDNSTPDGQANNRRVEFVKM